MFYSGCNYEAVSPHGESVLPILFLNFLFFFFAFQFSFLSLPFTSSPSAPVLRGFNRPGLFLTRLVYHSELRNLILTSTLENPTQH